MSLEHSPSSAQYWNIPVLFDTSILEDSSHDYMYLECSWRPCIKLFNVMHKLYNENSPPAKRRRLTKPNATLSQKIEVVDYIKTKKVSQTKAAKNFGGKWPELQIKLPLISSWMTQKASLKEKFAANQRPDVKKNPVTKCPQINAALELWISHCTSSDVLSIGDLLRQKWKRYATIFQEDGAEELKLSESWLNLIKARTGLKQVRRHGEGESVNINDVYQEIARL
ncbi:hypothetical protein K3495_g14404 [Podosphaera aphanis]|nr:hypothetical protein K3495_g14404 [Podosphaera aphanis]